MPKISELPAVTTASSTDTLPVVQGGITKKETIAQIFTDNLGVDLAVQNGGTGASDAATARTNLGLGTISTQNSNNVTITGGSITGITDLAIADGGTGASTIAGARSNLGVGGYVQDFRLSLTTGVPVSTADVVGATTVYCVPYTGNNIALFDGTNWVVRASAQFSLALGTLTAARPYDVFCYDNAGTPTLEFTAWTSATVRATALTTQDGVLVRSGAATRRYLGTFYTTATTTTEDSLRRRLLWNYYHRVTREMVRGDATATWNYTTATLRQANANALNQLEVVVGVQEEALSVTCNGSAMNTGAAGTCAFTTAIGMDSTSVAASNSLTNAVTNTGANFTCLSEAAVGVQVAIGFHFFAWLESSTASGTTTWAGGNASGIRAMWRC